jgi:hypothetical protein
MLKRLTLIALAIVLMTLALSCSTSSPSSTIKAPGNISGIVIYHTQETGDSLVVAAIINVWESKGGVWTKVTWSVSNNSGQYSITNVPPGTYMVTCHQDPNTVGNSPVEKDWLIQNVQVFSGQTTTLNLTASNALPAGAVLPTAYR